MSIVAILALATLCAGLAALLWREQSGRRRMTPSARRILFPIAGTRLSERALDAALRLARAEEATLVPAYLATVPLRLPIETAVPRQCEEAMPLLEAVEQRATRVDVPVDARIIAGRTIRHAVTRLFAEERFDRIIVTAGARSSDFTGEDIAWLLDSAPTEVVVLRPRGDVRRAAPLAASPVDSLVAASQ
jgi:nucleotide-binding universal stress UspA family protein